MTGKVSIEWHAPLQVNTGIQLLHLSGYHYSHVSVGGTLLSFTHNVSGDTHAICDLNFNYYSVIIVP